jgi:hypothetical protein
LEKVWVKYLILHSGGLVWSCPFKKCTGCWLSERKVTCCKPRQLVTIAARVIAVASAIRTDVVAVILALM